jgi:hypothetical protein
VRGDDFAEGGGGVVLHAGDDVLVGGHGECRVDIVERCETYDPEVTSSSPN